MAIFQQLYEDHQKEDGFRIADNAGVLA